jgi:hypothetical protein
MTERQIVNWCWLCDWDTDVLAWQRVMSEPSSPIVKQPEPKN